jgi:hypothetical protein
MRKSAVAFPGSELVESTGQQLDGGKSRLASPCYGGIAASRERLKAFDTASFESKLLVGGGLAQPPATTRTSAHNRRRTGWQTLESDKDRAATHMSRWAKS